MYSLGKVPLSSSLAARVRPNDSGSPAAADSPAAAVGCSRQLGPHCREHEICCPSVIRLSTQSASGTIAQFLSKGLMR